MPLDLDLDDDEHAALVELLTAEKLGGGSTPPGIPATEAAWTTEFGSRKKRQR